VEGDDEVDLRGGPAGGAGEAAMKVVEGVQVGGGGLADEPGEDVVAFNAPGRGAAGGLVVSVGEEVVEGDGEAAFPRGEAGAFRVAPQRERRWKEGERDAEAVAVEELDTDLGEGGGGGDVVHLEEHG
jgi:hypothetical protein